MKSRSPDEYRRLPSSAGYHSVVCKGGCEFDVGVLPDVCPECGARLSFSNWHTKKKRREGKAK